MPRVKEALKLLDAHLRLVHRTHQRHELIALEIGCALGDTLVIQLLATIRIVGFADRAIEGFDIGLNPLQINELVLPRVQEAVDGVVTREVADLVLQLGELALGGFWNYACV